MIKGVPMPAPAGLQDATRPATESKAQGDFMGFLAGRPPAEDAGVVSATTIPVDHAGGRDLVFEFFGRDALGRHRHLRAAWNGDGAADLAWPETVAHLHAGGRQEAHVLPWGLAANGHLAQVSGFTADRPPALPSPVPGEVAPRPGAREVVSADAAIRSSPAHDRRAGQPQAAPLPDPTRAMPAVEDAVAVSASANSPGAAPWVQRVVRWLQQQGQAPAIRVRDYRLDDAAASRLVEQLRMHARDEGIELDRIVVNARELWRAPSTATRQEIR